MSVPNRRFHGWLGAALALYLSGAAVAVMVHQHRDASQSHDCALCAVAQLPGALPADPAIVLPPTNRTGTLLVAASPGYEPRTPLSYPTRAPPGA
jgi:hypothetical protein